MFNYNLTGTREVFCFFLTFVFGMLLFGSFLNEADGQGALKAETDPETIEVLSDHFDLGKCLPGSPGAGPTNIKRRKFPLFLCPS